MSTFMWLVNFYAVVLTLAAGIPKIKELVHLWRTRHLRAIWGIKNRDSVIVVCSELDKPEIRQKVEEREFIYCLKYGDVDAYFEVIVTLLRLFPKIHLRVLSAGEALSTRLNLAAHLILIGGPDYNQLTKQIMRTHQARYEYRSPYVEERSEENPDEIAICDTISRKEYCETTDERDYGYFERLRNNNDPEKHIILIGGCHTIGVTGAIKAFSMAESEQGEIPKVVLNNARIVVRNISKNAPFSVLVSIERIGQTINTPVIKESNVKVRSEIQ